LYRYNSVVLRMTPPQRAVFDDKRSFLRGSWWGCTG
jgi:hypothetical protein